MVQDISTDDHHQTMCMGHMEGMFLRGTPTIMVMDHKVMDKEGILMDIPQIIFPGDQAKEWVPLLDLFLGANKEIRPVAKGMEGQVYSNLKTYKQWLTMMKRRRVDGLVHKMKLIMLQNWILRTLKMMINHH